MPLASPSAREQLIRIQRTLVNRIRGQILASLESPSGELRAYQREYFSSVRGLARRGGRPLEDGELAARLSKARVVFQGEYHTLAPCQAAAVRIVSAIARRKPVVLCVEAVPSDRQRALDAYLAREVDEEAFLRATDYRDTWGFAWRSYAPLFRLARERELQVYGLNAPSSGGEENIRGRDEHAADVVARAAISHPEAVTYVIAGDFRVCRSHLPRAVAGRLRAHGITGRPAIVHQNLDDFYWTLAAERRERRPATLDLGNGEYCAMNSTPLVKYQSYLHWQLGQQELDCDSRARDVVDAVRGLVREIARFLGVDAGVLQDFKLYTTRDLDFLADLEACGLYSRREIGEVKRQILNDESYFLSRGNIIYLSSLSVDHAAEEAAHYINNKLSGHVPCPLPPRMDFYTRILKEALGFLGSKIVNSRRPCHGEEDFAEIIAHAASGRAGAEWRPLVKLARLVLRHLEAERAIASGTSKRVRLRAIHEQPLDLHLGITHSLGYILGEKLHRGVVSGRIGRALVRELYRSPLSRRDEAERAYFHLVKLLP